MSHGRRTAEERRLGSNVPDQRFRMDRNKGLRREMPVSDVDVLGIGNSEDCRADIERCGFPGTLRKEQVGIRRIIFSANIGNEPQKT